MEIFSEERKILQRVNNNTLIVGSGDFDFFFRFSYPFFSENIFPEAYLLIYQPFALFFLIDFYKSNICSLWQVKQWNYKENHPSPPFSNLSCWVNQGLHLGFLSSTSLHSDRQKQMQRVIFYLLQIMGVFHTYHSEIIISMHKYNSFFLVVVYYLMVELLMSLLIDGQFNKDLLCTK